MLTHPSPWKRCSRFASPLYSWLAVRTPSVPANRPGNEKSYTPTAPLVPTTGTDSDRVAFPWKKSALPSRPKTNPLSSAPISPSGSNHWPAVTRKPLNWPRSRLGPTNDETFPLPASPAPGRFGLPVTMSGGTGALRKLQNSQSPRTHASS